MAWEIYNRVRERYDARDYDGALRLIGESRPALNGIRSHVACLEASCHKFKGDPRLALRLLEQEVVEGTDNFWVYYQIGAMYEAFGRHEDTIRAHQKAHAYKDGQRAASTTTS